MKIKAFTMAEVLIVLTILGVIAALTLPALNANIQKQQTGPALMRAISTLETANALVSQEQDFYNFAESCGDNYLANCFEPFVKEKLGAAKLEETITYGKFDNPSSTISTPRNGYITKNGFIYYVPDRTIEQGYLTVIDINGTKRPNVVAKDLFYVVMMPQDESCKVYAIGSKLLKEYMNTHYTGHTIYSSSWDAPYNIGGSSSCNADLVSGSPKGFYCAGSIVDNGGRVIYPW